MDWQPGNTAPKNGKPIWAWLYDSGIHLVRWVSAEENAGNAGEPENAAEYISCFVKVADEDDGDWTVKWWLPWDAITSPPTVGLDPGYSKWRDGAPPLRLDP